MDRTSILPELKATCPFPHILEDKAEENGILTFRKKIGHIRADYDGYRWWNTIWPLHKELATPESLKEMNEVYERLTSPDAFSTLARMILFCRNYPEAIVNDSSKTEYNFYYEGEHCYFWIRCILRMKDYNLYVHAFLK